VSTIKAAHHEGPCSIIDTSDVLYVVSEVTTALFGEYVSQQLCMEIGSDIDNKMSVPGYFSSVRKAILINCEFINATLPELDKLGDIQFADQEYRYSMDSVEKMVLLIEHEIIHYLIYIGSVPNLNDVPSHHGTHFRILAKNLFKQGWGDLAMAHLHHYKAANGDRATFSDILTSHAHDFNEEYITTVFDMIDGYFKKLGRAHASPRKYKTRRRSYRRMIT
jgi:hypothetical protein